jgi:hypothetical protein
LASSSSSLAFWGWTGQVPFIGILRVSDSLVRLGGKALGCSQIRMALTPYVLRRFLLRKDQSRTKASPGPSRISTRPKTLPPNVVFTPHMIDDFTCLRPYSVGR